MTLTTIKGTTRRYRKALRKIGMRNFPLSGVFHCREDGSPIKPEAVTNRCTMKDGPAPLVTWKRKVELMPELMPILEMDYTPSEEFQSQDRTHRVIDAPPLLPALNVEPVFRRQESIGVYNGKEKTRINYRPVRNPKAGECYYVKRDVDGKPKWVSVNYSDLLNPNS